MSSPSFVAMTALNGATIYVNGANGISRIEAVPTADLPPGVLAGSFIYFDGGTPRIGVQGTPADTATALASGFGGGALIAQIDGTNADVIAQNDASLAAGMAGTHNGAGDITMTIDAPGIDFGTCAVLCTVNELGVAREASAKQLSATTFAIESYDAAAAAANADVTLIIIPGLTIV